MDPMSHFLYQPRGAQTGKKEASPGAKPREEEKAKIIRLCVCACLMTEQKRSLHGEEKDEEKLNGEEVWL